MSLPGPLGVRRAYLGLGANLGDARRTLADAVHAIVADGLGELHGRSSLYRTAPVDASGPDYLNAVVALDTPLSPWALLDALQRIEARFGRERPYRNAPRTLDLDLLLLGDLLLDDERLQVPHPRIGQRAFVLHPLLELAPGLADPTGRPWRACLPAVTQQAIERLEDPWVG